MMTILGMDCKQLLSLDTGGIVHSLQAPPRSLVAIDDDDDEVSYWRRKGSETVS
jgi:hypothetical protein